MLKTKIFYLIRYFLYILPLPVIFGLFPNFDFTFGKLIFFDALVEIVLVFALLYFWLNREYFFKKIDLFLNPLVYAVFIFFIVSPLTSTIWAENSYISFWGDLRYGDGLFHYLHYFLYFFLLVLFFTEKEWRIFGKILAFSIALIILYAWLQKLGSIFFNLNLDRPGSFLGNPAYLSSYLILGSTLLSLTFYRYSKLKIIFFILLIFSFLTIFITETRGAILGLISGILIFFALSALIQKKKISALVLIFLVIAVLFFWFTRDLVFWHKIPGIRRVAEFDISSDPSFQTRFIALDPSFKSFKERPLFGWGIDNFNIAYNKYYNPAHAVYEEAWFDRAHNKLMDIAVMQGSFGLFIYILLGGLIFYFLFRSRSRERHNVLGYLVAVSAFGGYLVQNLFIFDTFSTYFLFFSFLAYLVYDNYYSDSLKRNIYRLSRNFQFWYKAFIGFFLFLILFSFVFFITIPLYQIYTFQNSFSKKVGEIVFKKADDFLYPYNFIQPHLRFKFLENLLNANLIKIREFRPLVAKAVISLEEAAFREKEPRYFMLLAETFNELGKEDVKFLEKAENYSSRALKLAPRRQSILYILSFSKSLKGDHKAAIDIARQAVELEPKAWRAHYNLAIQLALAGEKTGKGDYFDKANMELETVENLGRKGTEQNEVNNLRIINESLLSYYIKNKDPKAAKPAERLASLDILRKKEWSNIARLIKEDEFEQAALGFQLLLNN